MVNVGGSDVACDSSAFIDGYIKRGIVGKYTITYMAYDETLIATSHELGQTPGNPIEVTGSLYVIDTTAPTTGSISAFKDGDGVTSITDGEWVGGTDELHFIISGGSDNSYGSVSGSGITNEYTIAADNGLNVAANWWHAFSLAGGTTWYDYTVNADTGVFYITEL